MSRRRNHCECCECTCDDCCDDDFDADELGIDPEAAADREPMTLDELLERKGRRYPGEIVED